MEFWLVDWSQGIAGMPFSEPCCHFIKLEDVMGGIISFLGGWICLVIAMDSGGSLEGERYLLVVEWRKGISRRLNRAEGFCLLGDLVHQCPSTCSGPHTEPRGTQVLCDMRVLRAHTPFRVPVV